MSRIYFHTEDGRTEVSGSERAWLGCMIDDLAISLLAGSRCHEEMPRFMPPDAYPLDMIDASGRQFRWAFENWLRWNELTVDGEALNWLPLALNTALTLGSDSLKLAARIHGQCELHGYCEPENATWLAGIIDAAVASHVFRPDDGNWALVARMLRETKGPVVMSYSVSGSFPNRDIAGCASDDEDMDAELEAQWEAMSPAEQWRRGMECLRAESAGLELKPGNWESFRFEHCRDALWIQAKVHEQRLLKRAMPS